MFFNRIFEVRNLLCLYVELILDFREKMNNYVWERIKDLGKWFSGLERVLVLYRIRIFFLENM